MEAGLLGEDAGSAPVAILSGSRAEGGNPVWDTLGVWAELVTYSYLEQTTRNSTDSGAQPNFIRGLLFVSFHCIPGNGS